MGEAGVEEELQGEADGAEDGEGGADAGRREGEAACEGQWRVGRVGFWEVQGGVGGCGAV